MILETKIIDVTLENLHEHPQAICFINPKHEFYNLKVDWLKEQFKNGLKIKMLFVKGEKKPVGFIEYIPGEHCWRAIDAKDFMFIQCLWTNGKKYQHLGLGTLLLNEVEKDAENKAGIAVVTSDNAFMANRNIFLKNDFEIISESGKDQLLVKQFKDGKLPSINNWQAELEKYKGLNIIYSKQCPWVARSVEELKPIIKELKLDLKITEIKTPAEAQKAPSLYSVFNLIYNGKLLADRYISTTRFRNIVEKEII
ncbi:MAG: GNAT family N-acetyltransferase [Saprospiraceae bacterium]|nr:GNAT family N-acetyltransferase [Saprospiraceae bacterium]